MATSDTGGVAATDIQLSHARKYVRRADQPRVADGMMGLRTELAQDLSLSEDQDEGGKGQKRQCDSSGSDTDSGEDIEICLAINFESNLLVSW